MHFDSKLEYNHCTDILNYGSGITQSRTESLKTDKHTINKKQKREIEYTIGYAISKQFKK